ncbi:ABC transporter permease subunit [Sinirhodobacter populi]|uniref:ABC transporter permease subunit n=1 Tax=Paenirhodobacter populi TaxID=2306993 RepID=A0A443K092_9RHOB|nr:ABC transporter permease subunit [Sinirhodobacter populi]RWR26136.1 ABC transporter permease subunit [Sinirhodobacter populi]
MFDWFTQTWTRFGGQIVTGFLETFYMVAVSFGISAVIGTAAGIALSLCRRGGVWESPLLAAPLSVAVNLIRSVPFILLLIIVAPLARMLVGTAYGIYASMVSLSIVGVAVVTRLVEQAIADINPQLFQTAHSLSASRRQVITEFILVEARGALILGYTSAIISLIAYSTVVGVIAGGGIGYLALQEGFYMWNQPLMWVIIILMTIFVQLIQLAGSALARTFDRKGKGRNS